LHAENGKNHSRQNFFKKFYFSVALQLFVKIIERLELMFGPACGIVRDVLTYLHVSRSGLSESELQEVRV